MAGLPGATNATNPDAPAFAPMMRTFITEIWGLLYGGMALGLGEHWKLDPDEAREHTSRSIDLFNSIDKKTMDRLEKKYGKYIPGALLLSTVSQAVGSRVITSLNYARAQKRAAANPPPRVQNGPIPQNAPTAEPRAEPGPIAYRGPGEDDITPVIVRPNTAPPPAPGIVAPGSTSVEPVVRPRGQNGANARGRGKAPAPAEGGVALTRGDFDGLFGGDDPGPM